MSEPLLRCERLEVGYQRAILPPIDVELGAGEFWVVIGRNGSGKTTWFKTLLGLVPAIRGRIVPARRDLRFSYVPQRTHFDDLYPMRARDIVRMGLDRGWSFARPRLREPEQVERALVEVGAKELADKMFRSLSEGQKQRVLLARLLASDAELALLDEPTAAMDVIAERESFLLLDQLRKRHGMTIVVVSHFLGAAREFADRALLLDRDLQSVVIGTPGQVFDHETFRVRYGDSAEARGDHA